MNDGSELFNQALVSLRDCLGLQRGEELLILWDGTVSQELVTASRYAALTLGATPLILSFHPRGYFPAREYGLFAGASLLSPPPSLSRAVLAAMGACDRLMYAAWDLSVFYFSPEFRDALRDRMTIRMSYLSTEAALRLLPESPDEVRAVAESTRRVGRAFRNARRARVTSALGTDLTLSLGQYETVNVGDGLVLKGQRQGLPAGQVTSIPNDGSASGLLVIDRSIGANDYKELPEPVTLTVARGEVTSVSGGADADRLRRFLEEMDDQNIYHLTELAVGTNPRCRFSGALAPFEDTHTLGCVSLALGCDTHLGGGVRAPAHVDMTMRAASLELDGRPIVEQGRLVVLEQEK